MYELDELEFVDIVKAYEELDFRTFAIWIRLHMLTDEELKMGHTKMCKITKCADKTHIAAIYKMRKLGYVKFIKKGGHGNPNMITLLKVCKIPEESRFVNLYNYFSQDGKKPGKGDETVDIFNDEHADFRFFK